MTKLPLSSSLLIQNVLKKLLWIVILASLVMVSTACSASAEIIIPTDKPTGTHTPTSTATYTPDPNSTPTATQTRVVLEPTGGPSPTALLGASPTLPPNVTATVTHVSNLNAPRIEMFTSDVLSVEPGAQVTLFWAARGVDHAIIYRLNTDGTRGQGWNVAPDGQLAVTTSRNDRGNLDFVLIVGEDDLYSEQYLTIPIQCPITWFFSPAPDACPNEESTETTIIEQVFERGVMIYLESTNRIYVLYNDGSEPAWQVYDNAYDPEVHPEREESYVPPVGYYQPLRELGLIWRSVDTVRVRLGVGTSEAQTYLGYVQTSPGTPTSNLYIDSASGAVLHIVPGGDVWEVVGGS